MIKFISAAVVFLSVVASPITASAHVAVTPARVGIGSTTTFSVSVPNESKQPMTSLAIVIPSGLSAVTPTALNGWTVAIDKTGDSVSKLTWSNGSLEPDQRLDFTFSAQAPATASQLDWKAYQTFADGSVTHWDQKPSGSDDATGNSGPYSVTSVVNDLTAANTAATNTKQSNSSTLPLALSALAVILSLGSLLFKNGFKKPA